MAGERTHKTMQIVLLAKSTRNTYMIRNTNAKVL